MIPFTLRACLLSSLMALGACGESGGKSTAEPPRLACIALKANDRVWIPTGEVRLGSEDFEPEERPVREAHVDGFWIDRHEVTNAEFARFVAATGYRTVAERPPVWPEGAKVDAAMRKPGGIVFRLPHRDERDTPTAWWRWTPGAWWRHPEGPDSSIAGREHFPVLQVAYQDAQAYAKWAGAKLPTEAQWERAARGGHDGRGYIWGDEPYPQGKQLANTWQGAFPIQDEGRDGFKSVAPVGCFPANDFGLYDMAGNVWEWTRDNYGTRREVIGNVDGQAVSIRGGSWLCAPNFCGRFRPSARQPGDAMAGTTHIGFRTIRTGPPPKGT